MGDEKNLISLKVAAEKTGYSADYIGQLIRAGKIPGKQVYSNIAWMTTEEAVLKYKNKGKNPKMNLRDKLALRYRKFTMELDIIKLFFQTFKSSLPLLLVIISAFIILTTYLLYITFDSEQIDMSDQINQNQNQQLKF